MAHEVETMMYVQDTPWHGLGTYVGDEEVDSKTAIIKAGLDWNVELQNLYASADQINSQEVPFHKAVVRASDQQVLSVVGNRYHPIQNEEAFQFMDGLVDEGMMRYHTAGSLRGGQKIWLLGKIGSSEVVPGDKVDQYLFLHNSHSTDSSLRVLFTNTRVVCANTAQIALRAGQKEGVKVRHTKNFKNSLAQAKEVLGLAKVEFNKFEEWTQWAAGKQLTANKWNEILDNVIPLPVDENSKRAKKSRDDVVGSITSLYYNGVGQDIPGVAGTGWAAYNAIVEYVNYHKKARGARQQERRFEASLFGNSVVLVNNMVEQIQKVA